MPKQEQTPEKLKAGVSIMTDQVTTLHVNTPSIEILIGGPYKTSTGEEHNYGHAALRVVTTSAERVYDFGRYGATKGMFGAEGEGILRIWDKFDTYIAGENAYGRTTTGFSYPITDERAITVNRYYDNLVTNSIPRRPKHPNQKEFKLSENYHAVDNNCATMTLAGARLALPGIDYNFTQFNVGRGMTDVEKTAARAQNFGWPSHIFMPADVRAMLENNKRVPPKRVTRYGRDIK